MFKILRCLSSSSVLETWHESAGSVHVRGECGLWGETEVSLCPRLLCVTKGLGFLRVRIRQIIPPRAISARLNVINHVTIRNIFPAMSWALCKY